MGGLPRDAGVGRIGLGQSRQNPQKIYAFMDNQNLRPSNEVNPYEDFADSAQGQCDPHRHREEGLP